MCIRDSSMKCVASMNTQGLEIGFGPNSSLAMGLCMGKQSVSRFVLHWQCGAGSAEPMPTALKSCCQVALVCWRFERLWYKLRAWDLDRYAKVCLLDTDTEPRQRSSSVGLKAPWKRRVPERNGMESCQCASERFSLVWFSLGLGSERIRKWRLTSWRITSLI